MAKSNNGNFILRIEDIDPSRSKTEFEDAIYEDLEWLGIEWQIPVRRQSEHTGDYLDAIERLRKMNVIYPCFCTRKEIREESENSRRAPHGPAGPIYPGTCRNLSTHDSNARINAGFAFALRLNSRTAAKIVASDAEPSLFWLEANVGKKIVNPMLHGDIILGRKDTSASYHLAATLDDAIQGISVVTRGLDLMPSTHIQRVLQCLLKLPVPRYHHHRLISDPNGIRLSKRENSKSLRSFRKRGLTPDNIRQMIGIEDSIKEL